MRTALQLLENGESERALAALRNLLNQYPDSSIIYKANLELGRHALQVDQATETAIQHFQILEAMTKDLAEDEQLKGDELDVFLESLFLTGVAYYTEGNYSKLFNVLRRITVRYPNTVWANQAYYYIGMAHFLQENWGKAIRYLEMVGTHVDENAGQKNFVEAGQRLFVKVEDADLVILEDLGVGTAVRIQSKSGDLLELPLSALSRNQSLYVASAETEMGSPNPVDDKLQIIGGDQITIQYLDANTVSGEANVVREDIVDVVSTGSVVFTSATYQGRSESALIGQPVFVSLRDADLDLSAEQQKMRVLISVQYEDNSANQDGPIDFLATEDQSDEAIWRVRDEVELTLVEQANPVDEAADPAALDAPDIFHTGTFVGQVPIIEAKATASIDTNDDQLAAMSQDRIVVTYIDEVHAGGSSKRIVEAFIPVTGRYSGSFSPVGGDLEDPVDTARKNVIEAEAYYSLATIYDDMGLRKGAADQIAQGMASVDAIILSEEEIPGELRQGAYKLRWQMQILNDDLAGAIATCRAFNAEFPESRFADQALLDIGRALLRTSNQQHWRN